MNRYWDRTSKCLILVVDAGLNYYFLRTVQRRLVDYYGLTKYAPLVCFNARLMVLSISMDVSRMRSGKILAVRLTRFQLMLIILESFLRQTIYVQFHPIAYMVKLNIELSMASLITRISKATIHNRNHKFITQHLECAENTSDDKVRDSSKLISVICSKTRVSRGD